MAFRAGTVAFVLIDGVNGSGTNVSPYIDNMSWPQTVETIEVSAFGTAAKAFINGLTDGDTVTWSGPLDKAYYNIVTAVKAAQSAGSSTTTIVWGPGGSVAGEIKLSAEAYLSNPCSISVTNNGRVEYTTSAQITGAVTASTW